MLAPTSRWESPFGVTIDSGGKSASDLPIVDVAANTDNAIDLTGKITEELRTGGKAVATQHDLE